VLNSKLISGIVLESW